MREDGTDMRQEFLGPESGNGIVGWAVRQLALWLVAGLVVYWVAANFNFLRPSDPAAADSAAAAGDAPQARIVDGAAPPPEAKPVLGRAAEAVTNSLSLRARPDGYVYVNASVNGMPMRMAFDTGAAVVSLTQQDAVKAGVAGNLNYSMAFGTANGRALGAPVTLREIRIGQLVIPDVEAVVMQNMTTSLLGQTFLKRLESYQMKDGILTLSWQ
ncbi:MAG: TIGR02281 family clan AA aspartic protease [Alphaproteobacteria bacterium]|nr:TIGR02281 family clan AA aspartic protease [Alphaproteobacteria bacterium]